MTKTDTDLINRYLRSVNMEAYNSRAFKTQASDGRAHYEVSLNKYKEIVCIEFSF